jgi:hypothetical protein
VTAIIAVIEALTTIDIDDSLAGARVTVATAVVLFIGRRSPRQPDVVA